MVLTITKDVVESFVFSIVVLAPLQLWIPLRTLEQHHHHQHQQEESDYPISHGVRMITAARSPRLL